MSKVLFNATVNGVEREAWVWPHQTLLEVLRDELGATEVKYGCGEGVCGTCTVLLDGEPANACLMFAVQASGGELVTVLGLRRPDGSMHPLQRAFLETGAAQCGFCTPGMLLTAVRFLQDNPAPTRQEVRAALAGNLCRCTGYSKIVDAIQSAALEPSSAAGTRL
jgi:aerobic carbon-monoxide dehydrogenase small subunit